MAYLKDLPTVRAAFDNHKVVDSETNEEVLPLNVASEAMWDLDVIPLFMDMDEEIDKYRDEQNVDCFTWAEFKELYVRFQRASLDPLRVVKRFHELDKELHGADANGLIPKEDLLQYLRDVAGLTEQQAQDIWDRVSVENAIDVSVAEYAMRMCGDDVEYDEVRSLIQSYYGCGDDATFPALRYKRRRKKSVAAVDDLSEEEKARRQRERDDEARRQEEERRRRERAEADEEERRRREAEEKEKEKKKGCCVVM